MTLTITIAGKPVPWGVRVIRRGRHGALMLQDRSRTYQQQVGVAAHAAARRAGLEQLDGPLEVEVVAVLARIQRLREPGRHPAPVSPDVDRVLRNVLDGLHQYDPAGRRRPHAGVIWDDSRVVRVSGLTVYAAAGESAHTHITVRPYGGTGRACGERPGLT